MLGNSPNLIKNIYQKPPAVNIILHSEILDTFLLGSGIRQGYPLAPFHFNIILEALANGKRTTKRNERYTNQKEEIKPFLFTDDMICLRRKLQRI